MLNAKPGSSLKLVNESDKLNNTSTPLFVMGLAGNEPAHALMFKVESGSKSAIIIQYFITVLSNNLYYTK